MKTMNTSEKILEFVKKRNAKKQVQNLRGLVKSGETEWTFFYTFIDGDYLSISKSYKININQETGKISYVRENKNKKNNKQKIHI